MARFTTGPINNPSVSGSRSTQKVSVLIENSDSTNASTVLIEGYILNGSRILYVQEVFLLSPDQVIRREYFANFTAFEFVFTTSGAGAENTEISVWGKNNVGQLVEAHRVVSEETDNI